MKCPQCGSHDLECVTATNWLCLKCGGITREEQPALKAEAISLTEDFNASH
jgi:ribosomal protein L37AE/L43A